MLIDDRIGVTMNRQYEYVDYETVWDPKTKQDVEKVNYVVPLIDDSTPFEDQQLSVWAVNEDG